MPEAVPDPRVYFSAERTMLAWLRTGIAIMAFGFVVARFGAFLRLLPTRGDSGAGDAISSYLGAALVGLGIVALAGGAAQYRRFCHTLAPAELPRTASPRFALGLSWTLVVTGAALVVILLV
jgi:putative membrane protein